MSKSGKIRDKMERHWTLNEASRKVYLRHDDLDEDSLHGFVGYAPTSLQPMFTV